MVKTKSILYYDSLDVDKVTMSGLEHILKYKDRIWLTRPGDICEHIENLPEGTVPTS